MNDLINQIKASTENEKAYCEKHLTARPGKDQFGNWYTRCWTGRNLNEECKIIVEKVKEVNTNE